MMFALVQRCGKNLCLLALLCVLGVALAGFGGSAQSPATEPSSVGRATNLAASTVGQDDGSVRLTWSAASDAQVYFMVYLKSSDLEARNFGQVQMVPFAGTEGVVRGLEGGAEYSFIVTGMRWNWVNYGAVWGSWSDWETATPRYEGGGKRLLQSRLDHNLTVHCHDRVDAVIHGSKLSHKLRVGIEPPR